MIRTYEYIQMHREPVRSKDGGGLYHEAPEDMMLSFNFADVRKASPCEEGWDTAIKAAGLTCLEAKKDTTDRSLAEILDSNGLDDALWVLDNVIQNLRISSLFAADCAEMVLHLFERERPDDMRPRNAIAVARNADASGEERDAAKRAAMSAAMSAARGAARSAARSAAMSAAGHHMAAGSAAESAENAGAWSVESAAASEVWSAARRAQKARLRQYIEHGEAAASMPWPEADQVA